MRLHATRKQYELVLQVAHPSISMWQCCIGLARFTQALMPKDRPWEHPCNSLFELMLSCTSESTWVGALVGRYGVAPEQPLCARGPARRATVPLQRAGAAVQGLCSLAARGLPARPGPRAALAAPLGRGPGHKQQQLLRADAGLRFGQLLGVQSAQRWALSIDQAPELSAGRPGTDAAVLPRSGAQQARSLRRAYYKLEDPGSAGPCAARARW